ncbi:TIGR01777 family oxidoreductase [Marivirga salinae]|uniref:TIGR01777 family oxidoreductase n=1 Tax=Marivirga salinarum TaxID=3059078 RepID=A0AA49JBQ0_9BACT|nr:TIGR01777 family oxidoreductase [Marivirga sp. BDSF4-3]WKK76818.1 TIGR01777 family oxidoreductase [Marivirga sp. BDSF4-3]
MKKVLITGGSGLVGTEISALLKGKGYDVAHLTRNKKDDYPYQQFEWDIQKQEMEEEAIRFADVIIHLAGAGVADKKWTDDRKEIIIKSRTESASLLHKTIAKMPAEAPEHFISASAIGYYGMDTGDKLMDEKSAAGNDFLAEVTIKWEASVDQFETLEIPTTKIRIGIVLSDKGGALPQLAQPIKLYAGAPLGSGKQWMSWIHIVDLARLFLHVMENKLTGVYNGVGINPATNKEVTKAVAKALNKPLILPNVPSFAMKLILGEMAQMVLGGNKVSAEKTLNSGFRFKFEDLDKALEDVYGS